MSGIRIEAKRDLDWLHLELGRANAVGPDFLEALEAATAHLAPAEQDGPARPVIVTGEGSVFSAGLELPVLLEYDRAALLRFLRDFDRALLGFACLERPLIAAVNGHAVAGGAVLLLACDRKIGAAALASGKPYLIGLKESAIGLPLPRAAATILRSAIGAGPEMREIALTGDLFPPAEARERKLLDRLVPREALETAAEEEAGRFAQSTVRAAAALKRICRPELYRALETEPDDARFVEIWFSAETRKRISTVVAGLKKS